jgi:iron complex transport system substrate-binding protein
LWQNLAAVRAGQVYEVPDDTWMLGIGIGAANRVLDDLERILLEA